MKRSYVTTPLLRFANFALGGMLITFFAIASPHYAFAHSHSEFKIGDKTYQITVGSLNEPVAVDDKTGMDLRIAEGSGMPTMNADGDMDGPPAASTPATGLEKTLKVELSAGDKKKVLDLAPAYNNPGAYQAYFVPTVETTYTYRLFGTINGVEVNLSFACNPAGHVQTDEAMKPVEISPGVTQMTKTGAFGCPAAKADLGFPEQSPTLHDLQGSVAEAEGQARTAQSVGTAGVIVGLAASAFTWMKRKK